MNTAKQIYIQRFGLFPRVLHLMVIISFLTLAVTGMALKFAMQDWAEGLASLFGSFETLGHLHRFMAVITFFYFGLNFILMHQNWRKSGQSLFGYLLNKQTSLVPLPHDGLELLQTFKWFLGLGPQPNFGRWTYWEKFDFMAVFWGVAVIGSTGLVLWFPEFFTRFIPGSWLNIATIIHSDEALLAAGFIFSIHFYNTHLRPEKFPLDPVIFTGQMTLDEFKHERPREYAWLLAEGKLDEIKCEQAPGWLLVAGRIIGAIALTIGVTLIIAVIYSLLYILK